MFSNYIHPTQFHLICQDIRNLPAFLQTLSTIEQKLIHILSGYTCKYKRIFPSQSLLASMLNCSRKHVNRMIDKFWKAGVLYKDYRHFDSCVYQLSPAFYKAQIAKLLSPIFPYLQKKLSIDKVTLLNKFNLSKKELFRNERVTVASKVPQNFYKNIQKGKEISPYPPPTAVPLFESTKRIYEKLRQREEARKESYVTREDILKLIGF